MIQIFDCVQGSVEWKAAKIGIPSASNFAAVMAGGQGKTRRSYLLRLAAEIVTGEPMETFKSKAMQRGNEMEDEARAFYTLMTDNECQRIGFIVNSDPGRGCSPDSLIGNDGMLEIKTAEPDILADMMLRGKFPSEHVAQCQGALWTAEREWIDLAIYWPRRPLFRKRAYRDEVKIREIRIALTSFNAELQETVDKLRRYEEK